MAADLRPLVLFAGAGLLLLASRGRAAQRVKPHHRQRGQRAPPQHGTEDHYDNVPPEGVSPPTPAPAPIRVSPVPSAKTPTRNGRYLARRSDTHMHRGVDLRAPVGTSVAAAADGTVTHASDASGVGFRGYGPGHVAIDHGGVWTLYAHLGPVAVRPGQRVTAGQVVGYIAAGVEPPHVHFEAATHPYPMRREAPRIDPVAWLAEGAAA